MLSPCCVVNCQTAVSEIHKSLKRTREEAQNLPSDSANRRKSIGDGSYVQVPGTSMPDNTSGSLFTRPLGRLVKVQGSTSGTRYFGPTSLDCLILEFGDFVTHRIGKDSHEWRGAGGLIQDKIHTFVGQTRGKLRDGMVPWPAGPPLAILNAVMGPYFANVNPSFPINGG